MCSCPPGSPRRSGCPCSLSRATRSCCTPRLPLFPPFLPQDLAAPFFFPHRLPATRCRSLQVFLRWDATLLQSLRDASVPTSLSLWKDQVLLHRASPPSPLPLLLPSLSPHLSPHWQTCCCTLGQGFAGEPSWAGKQRRKGQGRIMGTVLSWVLLLAPSLPAPTAGLCCISSL